MENTRNTATVTAFCAQNPDITALELLLVDTCGILRGKWAPITALDKVFGTGVNLPLSVFGLDPWGDEVEATGLHIDSGDLDGLCIAVPDTLAPVTWAAQPTAQVLLTMRDPDGSPYFADPRVVLQRQVDQLAALGYSATAAFELEFCLITPTHDDRRAAPAPNADTAEGAAARQHMYGIDALADYNDLFDAVRKAAAAQGLGVDTIISEAAPGQFEINLDHRPCILRAADEAILLRRAIRGAARAVGRRATFMAKPFGDQPGNGMHVHVSLADRGGRNAFGLDGGEVLLSRAIAGTLATMAETQLLYNASFNGFRRMQPGSYAPTKILWGENNRSVAVRVPPGTGKARRLEHRIAGADANPYLVAAGILAGIVEGITHRRIAPPAVTGNAYTHDTGGEYMLENRMDAALSRFRSSAFVAAAFGADYQRVLAAVKAQELAAFAREITPLEVETYL